MYNYAKLFNRLFMEKREYFAQSKVEIPTLPKKVLSRTAFPILTLLSREQSLYVGLVPIDDERVIESLKLAHGRLLDVGCGANNLVRSYEGDGVGVDIVDWEGSDLVVDDVSSLPFDDESFDTVSFLASLNHIPNRREALEESYRLLRPNGTLIATMITPGLGRFIHWWRQPNDPDARERSIDTENELLGMSASHVTELATDAGFENIKRKRFAYGLNNIFTATKR